MRFEFESYSLAYTALLNELMRYDWHTLDIS